MWKTLKGYFIVEDEEGSKRKASTLPKKAAGKTPQPPAARPTPAPASAPLSQGSASAGAISGSVNDRSIKVLLEAMEAADLPGFDYLEFKKALQNLVKMDFTDEVRFKTAFATVESMGVTPKQLVDSAQHYLGVLDKEKGKFKQALAAQRETQVGKRENQLKVLDRSVKEQQAKIEELRAKIEKAKADRKKLEESIGKSTRKLDQTKADFEATLKVLVDGISTDVGNIERYLRQQTPPA